MITLFISLSLYRFEIEIEPVFATIALYDLKEKKKVGKIASKQSLHVLILSWWFS